MLSNEHTVTYLMDRNTIREILMHDAKDNKLSKTETKDYVDNNLEEVFTACNLQLCLMYDVILRQYHEHIYGSLVTVYRELGFVRTQKNLTDTLQIILKDVEGGLTISPDSIVAPGRFSMLIACILKSAADETEAVRNLSQCLGFLARFTLKSGESAKTSFDKFRAVNRGCKTNWMAVHEVIREEGTVNNYGRPNALSVGMLFKNQPSDFILDGIKFELRHILRGKPRSFDQLVFSTGSTAEGYKTLVEKINAYALSHSHWEDNLLHSTSTGVPIEPISEGIHYPKLIGVPKSLTSKRVIAPEPLDKAIAGQRALLTLRDVLTRNGSMAFINDKSGDIPWAIDGQDINRALAKAGSATGSFATVDLSSASDSISKDLFFRVCPESWRSFYANQLDWYYVDECNRRCNLHTLFTSGHPLTWDTEAAYFLAVARFCTRICGVQEYRSKCWSYGDDIILPTQAYDTVCDVLEILGHRVNRDKSYAIGRFRESCGGWYYNGEDVTPVFWPRSEVTFDGVGLQPMCKLQQRLLAAGRITAATYLTDRIREKMPTMTFSSYGEDSDDLWSTTIDEVMSERIGHYQITPKWKAVRSVPLDHYLYYEYLKYGPQDIYVLGVPIGITDDRRHSVYATGETRWSLTKPLYGCYGKTWGK